MLQFFTTAAAIRRPLVGAAAASHPWPEWERFVENLKHKGYFDGDPSASTAEDGEGDGGSAATADATMELNTLKNACICARTARHSQVCNASNLQESCDKAYAIQKEEERAQTVDLMRTLLSYALNTVKLSRGNPYFKENVQDSGWKLLLQLIEVRETSIDRSLPKAAEITSAQKEPSQSFSSRNRQAPNVTMKRGYWLCPKEVLHSAFLC